MTQPPIPKLDPRFLALEDRLIDTLALAIESQKPELIQALTQALGITNQVMANRVNLDQFIAMGGQRPPSPDEMAEMQRRNRG